MHDKGNVTRMAGPYVHAGAVVVDVGANQGEFTQWAAEQVGPTGTVIAIEPDRRCAPALQRLAHAHQCVQYMPVAVGRPSGPAVLYQAKDSPQSSMLRQAIEKDQEQITEQAVRVRTLDELVARADLVKIDAQGMDAAILSGATMLLQACPAWIVECWPFGLQADGQTPWGLWRILVEAGLTVCWAEGPVVTEDGLDVWMRHKPNFVNWMATR